MTREEFQAQMNRLAETYGPNQYKPERLTVIWGLVKHQSGEWLQQTVSRLIGSMRQAPLVPEFEEALALERERSSSRQSVSYDWTPTPKCSYCRDMGVFLSRLVPEPTHGPYAFRCACEAGLNDPRKSIPYYTQTHKDQGFVFMEPEDIRRIQMRALPKESA